MKSSDFHEIWGYYRVCLGVWEYVLSEPKKLKNPLKLEFASLSSFFLSGLLSMSFSHTAISSATVSQFDPWNESLEPPDLPLNIATHIPLWFRFAVLQKAATLSLRFPRYTSSQHAHIVVMSESIIPTVLDNLFAYDDDNHPSGVHGNHTECVLTDSDNSQHLNPSNLSPLVY